jgi:ribosomal protein S3
MGQKVNPLALRLGSQSNSWKSNWWVSSKEIYGLFLYEDQEIRKLIESIFIKKGFLTTTIRISRYHSFVKIRTKVFQLDSSEPDSLEILDFKGKCFSNILNNLEDFLGTEVVLEIELLPVRRYSKNFKGFIQDKGLRKNLLECFYKIERNPNLRQFKRSPFFSKTTEVIILSSFIEDGSCLLSKFIAYYLEKTRRHTTFIGFLRRILRVVITNNILPIDGLKIMIRGRVNGSDRRKNHSVKEGSLPLQKIKAFIGYSLSDSFTIFGVFGVKVWLCHKKKENVITPKSNKI